MMVRCFHRHDLGIVAAVLIAGFAGFMASAWAQDSGSERLSRAGSANRPVVIREHAGWDRDCAAIAPPALTLDAPPRHGFVCTRAEDITIRSMVIGTEGQCIGHLVRGVRLIYRPDAGFSGDDGLRYAALYPSLRRTVSVNVTVGGQGPHAGIAGSLPTHLTAPSHQPAGPVPPCADLLF
jgi:hypothetical protein